MTFSKKVCWNQWKEQKEGGIEMVMSKGFGDGTYNTGEMYRFLSVDLKQIICSLI